MADRSETRYQAGPDASLPQWQTVEEFSAECEAEDVELAAGIVWPDVDIVTELCQRAEAMEAEITRRRA